MYNRNYYRGKKTINNGKVPGKVLLIFIAFIAFFLFAYFIDSLIVYRGKVYPNVFTLNQDIGGLKRDMVYQILQPTVEKIMETPLLIDYEGWQFNVMPGDGLGATIDMEKLGNEAYSIGRRGSLLSRIRERIYLIRSTYQLKPLVKFNENIFESFYQDLQEVIEQPSRDAACVSGRVIAARIGVAIDRECLTKDIENSIINPVQLDNPIIVMPVNYQEPELTTGEILAHIGVFETLSSYETSLLGKEKNTLYNIGKSAEQIDGIIIKPGEVISFNRLVGPADKEDGYKESTIIANGQFVNGYGGGICQVSTTLYNAALLANLQIIERYNHSVYGKPTNYVPLGQDSAVFYGYKDLKIKNTLDQQIVIFSETKPDSLIITIWGEKVLDKEIRIISQDLKTYDFEVIEIKREEQRTGSFTSNLLQEGIPGYSVKTYRIIIDSSGEKMEFLSDDRYISVPGKVLID